MDLIWKSVLRKKTRSEFTEIHGSIQIQTEIIFAAAPSKFSTINLTFLK